MCNTVSRSSAFLLKIYYTPSLLMISTKTSASSFPLKGGSINTHTNPQSVDSASFLFIFALGFECSLDQVYFIALRLRLRSSLHFIISASTYASSYKPRGISSLSACLIIPGCYILDYKAPKYEDSCSLGIV
jgi:hypothetical protein